MLTVRSEIGPTLRFCREASHWAKAPSVGKKRLCLPNRFSFLGRHEDDDEHEHEDEGPLTSTIIFSKLVVSA
jgi:hypothetical protein